nr:MAG TPA: hypothetical protein [Caudoviricetes sp.]
MFCRGICLLYQSVYKCQCILQTFVNNHIGFYKL